jgi:hypothetical protein
VYKKHFPFGHETFMAGNVHTNDMHGMGWLAWNGLAGMEWAGWHGHFAI